MGPLTLHAGKRPQRNTVSVPRVNIRALPDTWGQLTPGQRRLVADAIQRPSAITPASRRKIARLLNSFRDDVLLKLPR